MRVLDQSYPIWTWTLIYSFLRDPNDQRHGPAMGTGHDELRTLLGFFLRQQGSFQTFLYNDPTDNVVFNQTIGIGDGTNPYFQLARRFGGFDEPITQPGATTVYVSGVDTAFDANPYGVVRLHATPEPGKIVTASFFYSFPVRFAEDTQEYENFMYQLWSQKKVTFQSVLLP